MLHQVDFHTFSLPSERTLRIVIKKLLTTITEQDDFHELKDQGFEHISVRQFGKPKKKLLIYSKQQSRKQKYLLGSAPCST